MIQNSIKNSIINFYTATNEIIYDPFYLLSVKIKNNKNKFKDFMSFYPIAFKNEYKNFRI